MEAIKLPLPAGHPEGLQIVSIWGERRLQGFADTGVFSIVTVGQIDVDEEAETSGCGAVGRCGDDGLASAKIEIASKLDCTTIDHGDHPFNRYG